MRKKNSSGTVKKFAVGAAVAAAAGYLTGILTAPKSGRETREDLKGGASEAEKELKKLYSELTGLIDDVKDKGNGVKGKTADELNDLIDKAKSSKDKASDLLNAVRSGDAEDKELQRAVADASRAIDHLRKFLKK